MTSETVPVVTWLNRALVTLVRKCITNSILLTFRIMRVFWLLLGFFFPKKRNRSFGFIHMHYWLIPTADKSLCHSWPWAFPIISHTDSQPSPQGALLVHIFALFQLPLHLTHCTYSKSYSFFMHNMLIEMLLFLFFFFNYNAIEAKVKPLTDPFFNI